MNLQVRPEHIDLIGSNVKPKGQRNIPNEGISCFFSSGHMDMLSCYHLSKLKGCPPSFFGLHVFGGMVLFFSDGIVVQNPALLHRYSVELA